jgi:curli biogenesis system outer membrane secretion channel CsgG
MTGVIVTELISQPHLRVFDITPAKLQELSEQTGFAIFDAYDPAVAAAFGKAAGADFVVCGELIHYAPEKKATSASVSVFSGGGTETRYWVGLNLRIVRSSDSKIVYAGNGSALAPEGYADAARDACQEAMEAFDRILSEKNKADD